MTSHPLYRGMAAMLLSVFLYSINDALLKCLAGTYHPMQIIFCRSFFILIGSGLYLLYHESKSKTLAFAHAVEE